GIIFEAEFLWVLIFAAYLIGAAVKNFVPENSVGGAIISAILCPLTYLIYLIIVGSFGYYSEDSSWTWVILVASIIFGAYVGYHKDSDDNE
ncbi:MAG: hypothetical protein Q4D14_05520, partial [Bacteroidales bacterium]|nr:hypothetical protein [Bacteroidales bacterium]